MKDWRHRWDDDPPLLVREGQARVAQLREQAWQEAQARAAEAERLERRLEAERRRYRKEQKRAQEEQRRWEESYGRLLREPWPQRQERAAQQVFPPLAFGAEDAFLELYEDPDSPARFLRERFQALLEPRECEPEPTHWWDLKVDVVGR